MAKIREVELISVVGSWAYDYMSCLHYSSNMCSKTMTKFIISVLNIPLYNRLDPLYLLTAFDFILLISYE